MSFRVKGRHLEHTLTRDNVMRDRHFEAVMKRLAALARERLGPAVQADLRAGTPEHRRAVFAALGAEVAWSWDLDAPLVPAVGRPDLSIRDLQGLNPKGLVRLFSGAPRALHIGQAGEPLAEAVASEGEVVIAAEGLDDPRAVWAAHWTDSEPVSVLADFRMPMQATLTEGLAAVFTAAQALLVRLDWRHRLHPARFEGRGASFQGQLAVVQGQAYGLEPASGASGGAAVMVDVGHPMVEALGGLPAHVGAALLIRMAFVGAGLRDRAPDVEVLLRASMRTTP